MERVRWPVIAMATRSGTPARTMFRAAVRRRSWNSLSGTPAAWQAIAQAFSEVSHGLAISVEHQRGDSDVAVLLDQPGLPATVNQLGQITFQHDGAASAGLGGLGAEPDGPGIRVHVGPLQRDDFTLPPAGEVGESGEVLQVAGQGSDHGFNIGPLEEALPGVVLGQHPDLRDGRQQLTVMGETQGPAPRKLISSARQSPKWSLRGLRWDRTEARDLTLRTL